MRPEEFVGGAGDDVGAYRVAVHGDVRGRVHGVDGDDGAHPVGPLGDGCHVVYGTDRVRGQADGHEPGLLVDVPFEVLVVEGEGFGIYADPAHHRPVLPGSDEPGVHVGAVVELGDDDLRALVPFSGEGAGDGEGQGGHVGPEGYLVGCGAEKVCRGLAGIGQDLLRLRARRKDAMEVSPAALHVAGDRVDGLPGHLRAAWSVEVDYTAAIVGTFQRRELLADGPYVERALHKPSHLENLLTGEFIPGAETWTMLT